MKIAGNIRNIRRNFINFIIQATPSIIYRYIHNIAGTVLLPNEFGTATHCPIQAKMIVANHGMRYGCFSDNQPL
jgi:hypothetical protein